MRQASIDYNIKFYLKSKFMQNIVRNKFLHCH